MGQLAEGDSEDDELIVFVERGPTTDNDTMYIGSLNGLFMTQFWMEFSPQQTTHNTSHDVITFATAPKKNSTWNRVTG